MKVARHEADATLEPSRDSFSEVESRIAVTRRRLRGYPQQQATLARLIAHIQKRQSDLIKAVLKGHNLNNVTHTALMMMYGSEQQTLTPSELSNASGERPTNVTRICDELLHKGLIERHHSTEDRRRVVLRLTRKGEHLVEQFQPELWQLLGTIYADFGSAELHQLTGLLRRIVARLDRDA
jgi:MarR family transcriptional regulator, negative regulator of the multidrug operon emrRAB